MSQVPSSSSSTSQAAPTVACPTCAAPSLFAPSNPSRPFCSERCKMIDLGAWGNEDFRVPAQAPAPDEAFGDPRLEP